MPGAWDDDRPRAEDGRGFDAPLGATAVEELEHELALAAALDRSRHTLSPDEQTSARMRRRLFEAMAEESFGRTEQRQDAIRPPAPAPEPSELTAPLGAPPITDASGPATRPVGPPVPDVEPDVPAASVGRAAGEHTLSSNETSSLPTRSRRARHVLPSDHPDHPVEAEQSTRSTRPDRDRSRPGKTGGRRRPSIRKRFGVLVTCVAALAVIVGVAATASKNALPGDALYGVKRATESTGGLFTWGDQAEATQQLEVARTRMDEVQGMLQSGSADPAAITSAMNDFDTATATGSRMILSGDRNAGGSDLADLRTWATAQSDRMAEMQSSWPAANASDAEASKTLLDRVLTRTEALRARTGCAEGGTASVDDLGPLPSDGPCTGQSGQPSTEGQQSPEGTTPDSTSPSPSGSTSPETSTSGGTSTDPTTEEQRGLLPPLLGNDTAKSRSGGEPSTSSSTTTTSKDSDSLLPPITLPPLLPGLGPVTIG
ncbi:DUF5667 domain-containing protein [Pseudonocardia endophytica]|uniref:DUF5667 domain-containing protein n=1 Tax=Pseudonocardia endophytica TaxID=401976 RepID=A0A4R1HEY3_PSEEN|nr:DUF5667 domain-containing protein [Pseudonocardia endophytica]TCK20188.1 hypothetical protein EV378_4138 [Pseudonocardia endophytica]